MRKISILLAILVTFSVSFAQKVFYVIPTKEAIGLYKNQVRQINEKPIETLNKESRLKVISSKGKYYKVKSDAGNIGWVEKRLVTKVDAKVETFGDAEVTGYLDNPTPLYITDMDQGESAPVDVDRSFKDALTRNADKEKIERKVQ